MDYLPLFLLFAAVLIAGWFYLQRAKRRDAGVSASSEPPASTSQAPERRDDAP